MAGSPCLLKSDMVCEAAGIRIPEAAVMIRRPNAVVSFSNITSSKNACKPYSKFHTVFPAARFGFPDSRFNSLVTQTQRGVSCSCSCSCSSSSSRGWPGPFESLVILLKGSYHKYETRFNKWKKSFDLGDPLLFFWQYAFFCLGAKLMADEFLFPLNNSQAALYDVSKGGYQLQQHMTDSFFEGYRRSSFDPEIETLNFFAVRSTSAIILAVMNIFRRKNDLTTSMVVGFGGGVMVALVNGTRGPYVIAYGVFSAFIHALNFIKMGGCNEDDAEWIEDREKHLLEILVERVKRDPNRTLIFNGTTDWIEMDEQIFMKYSLRYGPKNLKEIYHYLRYVHTKFSELINNTSVTWDFVSGEVFANVTRDKIFKSFKKKGCKIYPLLSLVFGSFTADSAFQNVSTCAPRTSQEKCGIKDEYLDIEVHGMRRMKKSSRSTKRSQLILARKKMDLAKAEQYKPKTGGVTSTLVEEYSIGDCMTTLEAILGASSKSYTRALTFFLDINWRKMFLMMSVKRRKEWLDSLDE